MNRTLNFGGGVLIAPISNPRPLLFLGESLAINPLDLWRGRRGSNPRPLP
jgi:hypothetical protein